MIPTDQWLKCNSTRGNAVPLLQFVAQTVLAVTVLRKDPTMGRGPNLNVHRTIPPPLIFSDVTKLVILTFKIRRLRMRIVAFILSVEVAM